MADHARHEQLEAAMRRINQAWLTGRALDLAPLVHPDIVMVVPGFAARAQGRESFLAGFRDFCENATIHEFREHDQQTDIVGDTGVVGFQYVMVYERAQTRYRATGRDLWVFERDGDAWIAVWRAMLEMSEAEA